MRLDKVSAKKYLNDVQEQGKRFWLYNGPVLKNIEELANSMKNMPDNTFKHHVTKVNNDFANWIKDVIGDKALADSLKKAKTKATSLKKLNERIATLKKVAK